MGFTSLDCCGVTIGFLGEVPAVRENEDFQTGYSPDVCREHPETEVQDKPFNGEHKGQ